MIVALVSGGVDSVVALDVLVRRGEDVVVLHVDHGLRADSGADAAFVRGLHPDVRVVALGAPAGNRQAWARDARYAAAFALADELGGCDVATGHTASDQVEGVLYRLAASPGRRALLGMRERSGRLVRPLLDWTRDDVLAHAREHGLRWREDPTNASDAYARNRARAALVPALRALHPAAERNVLRTLDVLRDEAAVLDAVVDDALAACGDDGASVAAQRLGALPPALGRLVLQALADRAAADAPAVGGRLGAVLALRDGTKTLDLGSGLRATVSYGRVTVAPAPPLRGQESSDRRQDDDRSTRAPLALGVPGEIPFLAGVVSATPVTGEPPRHADVVDARGRPLTVRARRPGDRMRPLGLGGSRSLQDLFVDRKVPAPERDAWPVVCAGEDVVWIPGVATAEGARVTPSTTGAVRLRWDRVRSGTE